MRALITLCLVAAALAASAREADLRFCVYGDTRDGHAVHRTLVSRMIAEKPSLVIQTGDLVHHARDLGEWKTYDAITLPIKSKMPLYSARGNHDVGSEEYEKRLTAPITSGNKFFYSFDRGTCHFVSVDAFEPYAPGSPQYKWLSNDLERAKGAKFVIAFMHAPPYSIGTIHGSDTRFRRALVPLFTKYKVSCVFSGHEHIYYRTRRDGITYVVTGGGGAPLYPLDPHEAIAGDVFESVHHYIAGQIIGNTLFFKTVREDNSVLDRFDVKARN
jgi:3',5'-cyclic AMP phosphodiesterase CpdA